MRLYNYLTEKSSRDTIIVDVQPFYEKWIDFNLDEFMEFLNSQKELLIFFNGEITGDTKEQIIELYIENGLNEEKINDMEFIDKGYGFFRYWMDQGVDEGDLKKVIRFMMEKNVNDTRDIEDEEWEEEFELHNYPEIENVLQYDDPLVMPDISLKELKKWSKSFLTGGGKNECLKEVKILMDTFNIKYKLVREFIYGV